MLPTESIVIDAETITPNMVARAEWNRPAIETTPSYLGVPLSEMRTFAPGYETHVTLHLNDGRTLKTTIYN